MTTTALASGAVTAIAVCDSAITIFCRQNSALKAPPVNDALYRLVLRLQLMSTAMLCADSSLRVIVCQNLHVKHLQPQ